jgi:hypothetical protein
VVDYCPTNVADLKCTTFRRADYRTSTYLAANNGGMVRPHSAHSQ